MALELSSTAEQLYLPESEIDCLTLAKDANVQGAPWLSLDINGYSLEVTFYL